MVQQGDTLSSVVRKHLQATGQAASESDVYKAVRNVARDNALHDPDLIRPGQRLRLCGLGGTAPAALKATPPPALDTVGLGAVTPGDQTRIVPTVPSTQRSNGTAKSARINNPVDLSELVYRILYPEKAATTTAEAPWSRLIEGKARLSSDFGMRKDPFTGRPAFHHGVDIAAPHGTEVHAFRPGEVTFSGWKSGYGKTVVVRHPDGLESIYGHTAKSLVKAGQQVSGDTVLAEVGSSGRSTGPHLHFELRREGCAIDPLPYLKAGPATLAQR